MPLIALIFVACLGLAVYFIVLNAAGKDAPKKHRCPSRPFGVYTHGLGRNEHQPGCPDENNS